ncbi:hypothetical protein E4U21_004403 [Claviceps maximensis]|nr:hypothetical protein E4U21_004403 [Claviceps maximensis]
MAQRPIAFLARLPSSLSRRPQRRLASDYTIQSKERIEALISGKLDETSRGLKSKHAIKRKHLRGLPKGRPRGKPVQELAEWDNKPARRDTNVAQFVGNARHDVSSALMENNDDDDNNNDNNDNNNDNNNNNNDNKNNDKNNDNYILPDFVQGGDEAASLHPGHKRNVREKTFLHGLLDCQSLGINALGRPAEAIILKNPNIMRPARKPKPFIEDKPADPAPPLNWQNALPQDEDIWEEVWQNIEEIRPQDTTVVRRKDFDKLMTRLLDGFTMEQLTAYLNNGAWDNSRNVKPSYPWILEQSPWTSVETESNQLKNLTSKERRAMLILSAKWKLEIQEHIEGLGGKVLWVDPNVFKLITQSSSGIIERLSNDFLNRSKNERISTHLQECRLGIYTGKPNVTTIISRLDEIVQTIQSQTISVARIKSENLTGLVLDELANITKTALQYDAENAKLNVSWLAPSNSSTGQVETPADIVFRLLIGRETVPHITGVHVMSGDKPSGSDDSFFLIHQREKRGMSWRDKLRQWYRHVNPVGKAIDMEKPTLNLKENIALVQPNVSMSSDEQAEVVATFGHILHSTPSVRPAKSGGSGSGSTRRVLSTCIPHPAALTLVTSDAEIPRTQKTAIVLHFTPDITTTTSPSASASSRRRASPLLRLRIPVHPPNVSEFSIPDTAILEAIIPWNQSDILLPGASVDVRLTQTRLLPLDIKSQGFLQDFLDASQFDLLQGKLHTPSRTTFSIPNRWSSFSPSSSSKKQDKKKDKKQDKAQGKNADTTNIPYMFTGLEIQQTIAIEWHGHTLQYSSIEAGQHAGQQQKLSLIAGPPQDQHQDRKSPTREQLLSFLTLVDETASGVHFSWDHGYKLMQEKAKEEFSLDMMDTEDAAADGEKADKDAVADGEKADKDAVADGEKADEDEGH